MGKLNPHDRKMARAARVAGILHDIVPGSMDLSNGTIMVACSDGDESPEMREYFANFVREQHGSERIHAIDFNGGVLVLSPGSPLASLKLLLPTIMDDATRVYPTINAVVRRARPTIGLIGSCIRQDLPALANIWGAIKLKNIKTVVLSVHAPCGAAGICKMDFCDVLHHLVEAKRFSKRMLHLSGYDVKMPCIVHVNWGVKDETDDYYFGRRSYFVKTHEAQKWLVAPIDRASLGYA